MTELVDVLSPFEAAMSQVEGKSKVTISNVCAVVIGLKKLMEEMILKLHICQTLPRILLDRVNTRLNPCLTQEDFRLATFLDPRFKADWLQTEMKFVSRVNTRLNPCLTQEDFRLATFLGPRFKADWLQTDEERALLKEASIQSTKELLKRKAAIKVDRCERSSSSDHNQNSS